MLYYIKCPTETHCGRGWHSLHSTLPSPLSRLSSPPSLGQLFIPTPSPCDNTKNPPFYELIHWAGNPQRSLQIYREYRWRVFIVKCWATFSCFNQWSSCWHTNEVVSVDQHQRKLLLSHKGPLSDVFESGGGREGGCISCVAGEGGKLSLFVTEQYDETRDWSCLILVIYS